MSLDVYLHQPACDKCGQRASGGYSANITHNLNEMADAAGFYMALWRPEEIGIKTAAELLPLLRAGLTELVADPARFLAFNPENGWGSYNNLVKFVRAYIVACEMYPDATVEVSR